jgi:hypothetical protein
MKKLVMALLCLIIPALVFSQNWKSYPIDDSVKVSLPPDFKKIDALGQTQITAETSFGFIQITKQPDNPQTTPDIEKLKHLNRYYDDFVNRIRTSAKNGIISNETDTTLGNLHVKDFTLAVDSGSGKHLRNFRVLHENGATYAFQYLYKDISAEYAIPESKAFFKSISVAAPAKIESQFTTEGNTTGKTPASKSMLYIWMGITAVIFLLIILYLRKKRSSWNDRH